jgi:hypothetical protein
MPEVNHFLKGSCNLQVCALLPIFNPTMNSPVRPTSLLLCLFIGLLSFGTLAAQPRWVVKVNPMSLFLGTLNLQAEYLLNDRISLNLGGYVGGTTFKVDVVGGQLRDRWMALTPELRFYPNFERHPAPRGLYAGPFLRFRRVRSSYLGMVYDPDLRTDLVAKVRSVLPTFGLGGVFGYQFMLREAAAIDVYAGPYFSAGTPQVQTNCAACNGNERPLPLPRLDFSGMEFRFGASIGLPF